MVHALHGRLGCFSLRRGVAHRRMIDRRFARLAGVAGFWAGAGFDVGA
jgi:hypothetical protein